MTDDDRVFKALADPTRRFLLDRLFERDGRTLTELESELEMTRFGVMKHLRVLEDAGLVVARRSGREKLHFLNPVPIRLIHDRWIDKYTERQVSALADLKNRTGGDSMSTTETTQVTTQVYRVYIKATPAGDLGRDHEARVERAVRLSRPRRVRPAPRRQVPRDRGRAGAGDGHADGARRRRGDRGRPAAEARPDLAGALGPGARRRGPDARHLGDRGGVSAASRGSR